MTRHVIRPNQLGQYELRLKMSLPRMPKKVIEESSVDAIRLLQDRIRSGRPYPPIDRGRYLRGWRIHRLGRFQWSLINVAKHAIYVEGGRRRGARRPPISAIQPWVQRKFGLNKKAAKGVAFAIANKIHRRGIRAKPFGRRAIPEIKRIFRRHLERANATWIRTGRV